MKLTTMIEWHNLLENPDDLPTDNDSLYLAFLDDRDNRIYLDGNDWEYDKDGNIFVLINYDDFNQYYDEERLVQDYGKLAAWAKRPKYDYMEDVLNKEILGKEV